MGDDNPEIAKALEAYGKATDECMSVERAKAIRGRDYRNINTNVDVRTGFTKSDYYAFRPFEAVPTKPREIVSCCMRAYEKVGLIKNVIDLMADFACKGIRLVHPNPRIEQFYQDWFNNRVKGPERSERFLNMFYKAGNVIALRQTAKVPVKKARRILKTQADPDLTSVKPDKITAKSEIPWGYNFLNPYMIEDIGDPVSQFFGVSRFGLKMPGRVRENIKDERMKEFLARLPENVQRAILEKKDVIPLPPDKTITYHYKKDDWQVWANPMIYAILDDIIMLEKLKLADYAALDGATAKTRIWKLGDLQNKILPTDAAVAKLGHLLNHNVGNGVRDIIWGPAIELLESATDMSNFLGEAKYIPHINSIQTGLGIPPLLGSGGSKDGMTNNFLSLKTLIERLEYGRKMLVDFWNKEIAIVQKAYGFALPALVVFDHLIMSDETTEKKLYIELWDRYLVSDERVRERFGESTLIESARLRKERKDRDADRIPQKGGPYFNGEKEHDLKKIALQSGSVAPSEVGLELEERKPGEKPALDQKQAGLQQNKKPGGVSGQGRPSGSKDSVKRKRKVTKPITNKTNAVKLAQWASKAQEAITKVLNPAFLKAFGKKNLRQLNNQQVATAELRKFAVLCAIDPFSDVTPDLIKSLAKAEIPSDAYKMRASLLNQFKLENDRDPFLDEVRDINAEVYVECHG